MESTEIKLSEIFYTSARCTCPHCKQTTMIDSEEINRRIIVCFHCDETIKIKKDE